MQQSLRTNRAYKIIRNPVADEIAQLVRHGSAEKLRARLAGASAALLTQLNEIDYWGQTSLTTACLAGAGSATVGTLLKAGANPNAANIVGTTPLDIAASKGAAETISVLLRGGASPHVVNLHGFTPLQVAMLFNYPEAVYALTHA